MCLRLPSKHDCACWRVWRPRCALSLPLNCARAVPPLLLFYVRVRSVRRWNRAAGGGCGGIAGDTVTRPSSTRPRLAFNPTMDSLRAVSLAECFSGYAYIHKTATVLTVNMRATFWGENLQKREDAAISSLRTAQWQAACYGAETSLVHATLVRGRFIAPACRPRVSVLRAKSPTVTAAAVGEQGDYGGILGTSPFVIYSVCN